MSTRHPLLFPVGGAVQGDPGLAAEAAQAWRLETVALEAEWELAMAQAWEDWWRGIGPVRPAGRGDAGGSEPAEDGGARRA